MVLDSKKWTEELRILSHYLFWFEMLQLPVPNFRLLYPTGPEESRRRFFRPGRGGEMFDLVRRIWNQWCPVWYPSCYLSCSFACGALIAACCYYYCGATTTLPRRIERNGIVRTPSNRKHMEETSTNPMRLAEASLPSYMFASYLLIVYSIYSVYRMWWQEAILLVL